MEASTMLTLLSVSYLLYALVSWLVLPSKTQHDEHVYTGEYSEAGNYHGKGQIVTKQGDYFEGNFNDGKIEGYGEWFRATSQSRVAGVFKDGEIIAGREMRADGSWYEGHFHGGRKSALGTHISSAPQLGTYIGGFKDGYRHGPACVYYHSGEIFEGTYKEGVRDGPGVLISANGNRLHGIWQAGKLVKWVSHS